MRRWHQAQQSIPTMMSCRSDLGLRYNGMKNVFLALGILGITAAIIFLNRYNAAPAVGSHIYWLGVAGVAVGSVGFIGFAVARRRE